MLTLSLVLLIAAFITFLIAAFNFVIGKINLVALGLALWVLSLFVNQISA